MKHDPKFISDGYFTHQFTHLDALQKISDFCLDFVATRSNQQVSQLKHYHLWQTTISEHEKLQYELFEAINSSQMHWTFVEENLEFFQQLVGPDLDIQTQCYLRIARPGSINDNIGIHRDTDYGNSAYELSLSLPLIDQQPGAGLNIVPGSHLIEDYKFRKYKHEDIEKGTDKNKMGFPYAPKIPLSYEEKDLKCVSLPFGHGLVFTLGLLHGQIANKSDFTRWSIDFRFKNAMHPVNQNLKQGYYSSFSSGSVSKLAASYYACNTEEKSELHCPTPQDLACE